VITQGDPYEIGGALGAIYVAMREKWAAAPELSYGLKGRLYFSRTGWLLLSVPNALGRGAFDALNEQGIELPYSDSTNGYNAHISVMSPEDIERIPGGADAVNERGHEVAYTLGPVRHVQPRGQAEMEKVWFIEVHSPALERLRRSYGLTSRPRDNRHRFHISFAVRRKAVLRENGTSKAASLIHYPEERFRAALRQEPAEDDFSWGTEEETSGEKVAARDGQEDVRSDSPSVTPIIRKRRNKVEETEYCPHCKEEIREKSMYCDPDGYEYHRPCQDKGPIGFNEGGRRLHALMARREDLDIAWARGKKEASGDMLAFKAWKARGFSDEAADRLAGYESLDTPVGELCPHCGARLEYNSEDERCNHCGKSYPPEKLAAYDRAGVKELIAAAVAECETPASEEQAAAGNYKKGHFSVYGIPITIETGKGMTRSGTSKSGKKWSTRMKNSYGYIKQTESEADGDHIDVFLNDDDPIYEKAFLVDQLDPESGDFDEGKVMLFFPNEKEAKTAYLVNYEKGWKGFGGITELSLPQFKRWLEHGETHKPFRSQTRATREKVFAGVSGLAADEGSLSESTKQALSLIRQAGNQSLPEMAEKFSSILRRHGCAPARDDARTQGQQQRLLARQLLLGDTEGPVTKQGQQSILSFPRSQYDPGGLGRGTRDQQEHTANAASDLRLASASCVHSPAGDKVAEACKISRANQAVAGVVAGAGYQVSDAGVSTGPSRLVGQESVFDSGGCVAKEKAAAALSSCLAVCEGGSPGSDSQRPGDGLPMSSFDMTLPGMEKRKKFQKKAAAALSSGSSVYSGESLPPTPGGGLTVDRLLEAACASNTNTNACDRFLTTGTPNSGIPCEKSSGLLPSVHLQPQQSRVAEEFKHKRVRKLLYHSLGSGKTLSAIAGAETGGEPYTAVVPAALRPNFQNEQARWTDQQTPSQVESYNALAKEVPSNDTGTVIFDEAQRLRNENSLQTQNAKQLAAKAHNLLLLSGTPIVNSPGDFAPLAEMLTGQPQDSKTFESTYVGQKKVRPSLLARLRGVQPATVPVLRNREQLHKLLAGHIDYHAPATPDVQQIEERYTTPMSPQQTKLYQAFWKQLPWILRWKLQHEFPLSKQEIGNFSSFLAGPRQVSLSTLPFMRGRRDPYKAFQQSPKLQRAMQLAEETLNKDPKQQDRRLLEFPRSRLAAIRCRAGC
jgi:hypothetical protein